jgi:alkanesulfonate monooxygenase
VTVSIPTPRFGIWALVHGNRAALHDPEEPYDASWERNRQLILEAEALGYESTLVAQHTRNPHSLELDQLEAWTASAALAALTQRIEIITAIKPLLYHPAVLAKMALQIEHISGGRFGINLVNAWNRLEFVDAGIPFPDHDERYAYGAEWLAIVENLLRGANVSFRGRHFQFAGYQLRPRDPYHARPAIYLGGESEPAKALAVEHADVWFINGQPPERVAALIADLSARPRLGPKLRFALSAFVVARETDEEAAAVHAHLLDLAAKDAQMRAIQAANTDPEVVMKQTQAKFVSVGTNGGTAAGLVGSYDTIARRIAAFNRLGIETFMLQFQPFEREMRRFAEQVRPRVDRLLVRG